MNIKLLNCNNILQCYCFNSIFYQLNAALLSIEEKHLYLNITNPKVLNGSVYMKSYFFKCHVYIKLSAILYRRPKFH